MKIQGSLPGLRRRAAGDVGPDSVGAMARDGPFCESYSVGSEQWSRPWHGMA